MTLSGKYDIILLTVLSRSFCGPWLGPEIRRERRAGDMVATMWFKRSSLTFLFFIIIRME